MIDEKHQKKKTRCCSVPWISCFERRDERNGRMTPQALNKFFSEFLMTVRKKEHNEEYEPNSLRNFFASFERQSKKNKLWTLPHEKRPVRANSESASVKAKGSKTERHGQQALCFCCFKWGRCSSSVWKGSLGKFHGRSTFKHGMVQQRNPFRVTRLQGA